MEEQAPYGISEHEVPSYLEKVQSQLPALQLLISMGWAYLTPEETVKLRGGRLGSSILEPILLDHIRNHCCYDFKGNTHPFAENAIQNAVQALKAFRATGATHQNEQAYDLLCLGVSVPQTIEGDTKSFTIDYIDWKNPERNAFHCTAEYKVERVGYQSIMCPTSYCSSTASPLWLWSANALPTPRPKNNPSTLPLISLQTIKSRMASPSSFSTARCSWPLRGIRPKTGQQARRDLFGPYGGKTIRTAQSNAY
jgi:type I restriction enzyme R subunit